MPALNFQARFVAAVENGLDELAGRPLRHPGIKPKRQTIRARRKDGRDPKPGQTLYLFTGMRTKACRKLGEVRCQHAESIVLPLHGLPWFPDREEPLADEWKMADADGFTTPRDMRYFFERTHGLPFDGVLIRW